MIDYEKLKEAYMLVEKYRGQDNNVSLHYYCDQNTIHPPYWAIFIETEDPMGDGVIGDINDIIDKLTKLIQPGSKYKVGDKVWLLNNFNTPTEARVVGRISDYIDLEFEDGTRRYGVIEEPYPTKESLIEAQIAHWTAMREPSISEFKGKIEGLGDLTKIDDEDIFAIAFPPPRRMFPAEGCQHESTGLVYSSSPLDCNDPHYKCKKCGDFYKVKDGEYYKEKQEFQFSELVRQWTGRIAEHYKDKTLAEKCGLNVEDICVHEPNGQTSLIGYPEAYKCKKCMVYYR